MICGPVSIRYPLCFDESNNAFMLSEQVGGGEQLTLIEIPPGVYLPFFNGGTFIDPTGCFQNLYEVIRDQLETNSKSGATYVMNIIRPTSVGLGSVHQNTGLEILSDLQFRILFDDNATSVDPGVFGFPSDQGDTVLGTSLVSTITPLGVFVLDKSPVKLQTEYESDQCFSSSRSKSRQSNRWGEYRYRRVEFRKVFGSHIFSRQNLVEWAGFDDLSDVDENNHFLKVWRNALSQGLPILLCYSDGETSTDFNNAGGYEIGRLFEDNQVRRFQSVVRPNNQTQGEYYDIGFDLEILATTYKLQ